MIKAPSPDILELLNFYHEHQLSGAISIFFRDDGDVQVSVQRKRENAYFGHTAETVEEALRRALSPGSGVTWPQHVEGLSPKLAARMRAGGDEEEAPTDTDDDYLDLI